MLTRGFAARRHAIHAYGFSPVLGICLGVDGLGPPCPNIVRCIAAKSEVTWSFDASRGEL